MSDQHGMNCPARCGLSDDACTCGLDYRTALSTEQTMHAAWRKRAEEAETEVERLGKSVVAFDDRITHQDLQIVELIAQRDALAARVKALEVASKTYRETFRATLKAGFQNGPRACNEEQASVMADEAIAIIDAALTPTSAGQIQWESSKCNCGCGVTTHRPITEQEGTV